MTTVLLIDDDVISVEGVTDALAEGGYNSVSVSDPAQALEAAVKLKPDFIIIDLVMPDKTGLELCREFKLHPLTREVPIMFLSSSDDTNHAIVSLHLGCVDYLSKPIGAQDLAEVIEKHNVIRRVAEIWQPAKRELERIVNKYREEK